MLRMEFPGYSLEDRSSVFLDDIELPIDVLERNKNLVKNLNIKNLCDFDKNMLGLDREIVDGIGFVETVVPHVMRKSVLGSPRLGVSSDEFSATSISKLPSTSMINLDHLTRELGFGAELPGTAFETNNEKESMIDLRMEKFTDSKEVSNMLSSEESLIFSLVEDSLPAKRARTTNLYPQIPICQVQGCCKDLSSSKDYHKRHRVCDIHSKTSKVIINGIEQRFCQQCSRFHLLAEFDDGKRSCRKRLAGHNERRRKPQFGAHLGSRFFDMNVLKSASFLSPETLPGGFYYQERNVSHNRSNHIKLEQVPIDISQLAVPANGQSPQKFFANPLVIRNQHHSRTCDYAAVEVELPMLTDSRCALSLLSAKSAKSSSHTTSISKISPPSTRENQDAHIVVDEKLATQLGTSTIRTSAGNRYFSSGKGECPMVHGIRTAVCSGVQKDGFLPASDYNSYMHCISPEVGSPVDLLQLSSHLQRVEQLRNSMQMKQENYTFC